jgi:hypothetical protein
MITFRAFASLVIVIIFLLTPVFATAGTGPGVLTFIVDLDGKPIGKHVLTFTQKPDHTLETAITIDLEVKFGPFTVFDYTHQNASLWKNDRLQRMRSETNNNGERNSVAIDVAQGQLQVVASKVEPYTAESDLLPTTYWMFPTVAQKQIINSETGELLNIEVHDMGRDIVASPDGAIEATRYRMTGDLEIDLWYDDAGILVCLSFEVRGSKVTYRLSRREGVLPLGVTMPKPESRG